MSFLAPLIAPALALLAAFLFGLLIHLQRRGLAHVDDLTGVLASLAAMATFFWIIAAFTIDWRWFATDAALLFAGIGVFFPAASQFLQIVSVQRVGTALTSAIGSFTPIWAVVPALIFLNEKLGVQGGIGMGLMILGLLLSAMAPKSFRGGWPVWALALPLGASLARGIVQPVVKAGYQQVPSPIFASVIMGTVSTLVILAIWLAPQARIKRRYSMLGLKWFALSGIVNGVAILSLFMAIDTGNIAIVTPLSSTAPVFALALGVLVFRTEQMVPRHYAVVGLTVLGAVILVSG